MINTSSGNAQRIVSDMHVYMENEGLIFKKIKLNDSSPYAILAGKSSIGFRNSSKWNKSGIVFFCTKIDADNLSAELSLNIDDNRTDKARPYAVFIPNNKFEAAVEVLKWNPLNTGDTTDNKATYSKYQFVRRLDNKANISLIKNIDDGNRYVRKEYDVYNFEVFERINNTNIDGIPHIVELYQKGKK